MAITTLAGVTAGLRAPFGVVKTASPPATSTAQIRWANQWYVSAGSASAPAPGINGAAVTTANAGAGQLLRVDAAGGEQAYVARLSASSTVSSMSVLVLDRLWHNSAINLNITTLQSITPVAMSARDDTSSANGAGVFAAFEYSTAGPATASTVTISYTNSAGTAGRSASFSSLASPTTEWLEVFPLAQGDGGVRSIQSIQFGTARASGVAHLVLLRLIAAVDLPALAAPSAVDAITGAFPKVPSGAVLQLACLQSSASATSIRLSYQEAHG